MFLEFKDVGAGVKGTLEVDMETLVLRMLSLVSTKAQRRRRDV